MGPKYKKLKKKIIESKAEKSFNGLLEPWCGQYRKVVAFGKYQLYKGKELIEDDHKLLKCKVIVKLPKGYSLKKSKKQDI